MGKPIVLVAVDQHRNVPCVLFDTKDQSYCGQPATARSVGVPGVFLMLCPSCYEVVRGLVIGGVR